MLLLVLLLPPSGLQPVPFYSVDNDDDNDDFDGEYEDDDDDNEASQQFHTPLRS